MNTRTATSLPYTELEVADGNFDSSRSPIDRVIIHTMVGAWQGAAARFDDPASKVSAHYGVKLDGSLIHWLEEYYTAYHAGDYPTNQRSIGIEHEDGGDYNGTRPDALYAMSAKLVRDVCQFYAIPIDRQHILKHSEVSDAPTGCPDALDIDRIVREAANPPADQQATVNNLNDQIEQLKTKLGAAQTKIDQLQPLADEVPELQQQVIDATNLRIQAESDRTKAQADRDQAIKALASAQANDYTRQQPSTLLIAFLQSLIRR